jgi:hypothetical protein
MKTYIFGRRVADKIGGHLQKLKQPSEWTMWYTVSEAPEETIKNTRQAYSLTHEFELVTTATPYKVTEALK